MNIVYTATVTASGGRDGRAQSSDGLLDLPMSMPSKMGGAGKEATNPEQLFAAGYAACFENAVLHVAKQEKLDIERSAVTADVALGVNDDGSFGLDVALKVDLGEIDRERAQAVIREADRLCPYSNAVRGNVNVDIQLA